MQSSALGQSDDEPEPGTFHTVVIAKVSPARTRSIGLHVKEVAVSVPAQLAPRKTAEPPLVEGIGVEKTAFLMVAFALFLMVATYAAFWPQFTDSRPGAVVKSTVGGKGAADAPTPPINAIAVTSPATASVAARTHLTVNTPVSPLSAAGAGTGHSPLPAEGDRIRLRPPSQ
jgi:hypothetical protein